MLATVEMNPLHRHPSMRHEIVVVVKTTNVDRQRPNHGIDGIDMSDDYFQTEFGLHIGDKSCCTSNLHGSC